MMAATKTRHMTTVNTFRDQNITRSSRAAIKAAATLLVCAGTGGVHMCANPVALRNMLRLPRQAAGVSGEM